MKIMKPCLFGLACLAVATSLKAVAEDFTCETDQSNCLYDSVAAANQTSGPDTIRFAEGAHFSSAVYPSRCAPSIEGDITIIGASRVDTHLFAQGSCAYFHVAPEGSLTLQDIVLADGNLDGLKANSGEVLRGAGVHNEGTLRIERTIFRGNGINDNFAKLSGGGAIYNAPGARAEISDVEFFNNSIEAENYGGAAILNEGDMTVTRSRFFYNNGLGGIIANGIPGASTMASLDLTDSVIVNNYGSTGIRNGLMGFAQLVIERTTIRDGDGVEGGGIYNSGELTVRESSIVRNTAIKGGGIYSAKGARSTFVNSTISQNHARGKAVGNGIGGGVYNHGGVVFLASSTIASNTSQGFGAAIAVTSDAEGSAQVYVKGSLIVGHANTRQLPACYDFGPNDARKLFLVENNLITAQSNCYLPSETDVVVNEADTFTNVISSLSDYGSLSPNFALLRGSPAIDSEDKLCTDFDGMPIVIDQRGNERTGCDKGSVDASGGAAPVQIQLKGGSVIQPNSTSSIDVGILSRSDTNTPFRPVAEVNRSAIRLGSAVPLKYLSQDLNSDGVPDLVIRFKISDIGIACGDSDVELQGAITNGGPFTTSAEITTSGCN
jgi:hypothetical protein